MLTILYVFGAQDTTLPLDPDGFTGDPIVDRDLAYVQGLVAGRAVQQDSDGYAQLADGARGSSKYKGIEGVIINDAAGNAFENWPALASMLCPIVTGGLIETDQVVDTDVTYGDPLYVGTSTNVGLFTTTDPGTSVVVGVARSENSVSDKTLRIRLFLV